MKTHFILLLVLFSASLSSPGQSRGTNSNPKIFRDRVEPHWFADDAGQTNRFWYRVDLPGDRREFVLVDAAAGRRGSAFDHERLAKTLAADLGTEVDSRKLPIESLRFSKD